MAGESKRAKLQKEDRISDLPDSVIHHILSLLPSTKEAIQTTALSKRWYNQWTHVPVLVFDGYAMSESESDEKFSRFIDNTLLVHDCSKIQKFDVHGWADPHFSSKLVFAIRRNVKELILDFKEEEVQLPDFLLKYASLVKLEINNCLIMRNSSVRWEQLRELKIEYSTLHDAEIESILIGSPLLERLEIIDWYDCSRPVVSSQSLKELILVYGTAIDVLRIEISCPKLVELKLSGRFLKSEIEIKNLSSLIRATLDFYVVEDGGNLVEVLQQLRHVKELTFGNNFIEGLNVLQDKSGQFSPLLNNRILTLYQPDFWYFPGGIEYAIRISPVLEKLVIKYRKNAGCDNKYWKSKGKTSDFLLSHLKTVHIVGPWQSYKSDVPHEFVDFISKKAPVLENLVMSKIADGFLTG